MIKIETYLYDSFERAVLGQAMDIIEQHRYQKQEAQQGNAAPGQRVPEPDEPPAPPAKPADPRQLELPVAETPAAEPVVAAITPAGAVTKADFEKAVHAALKTLGTAKLVEIVRAFGGGRVLDMPAEKWPEIMKALAEAK